MPQLPSPSSARAPEGLRLYARDTVFGALRLMQRHGVSQLPVVDEDRRVYLGDVSEEELYRLWAGAPLARLGEVLRRRLRLEQPAAPVTGPHWLH